MRIIDKKRGGFIPMYLTNEDKWDNSKHMSYRLRKKKDLHPVWIILIWVVVCAFILGVVSVLSGLFNPGLKGV